MSAGIAMSDMIAACTVGLIRGHMSLDLSHSEIVDGGAYMPVVIKARSQEVVFMQLDSRLSFDLMKDALEFCVKGCNIVRLYLEAEMKMYMQEQLERIK
jgi:ribonuclease PH